MNKPSAFKWIRNFLCFLLAMLLLLSGNCTYHELHNAITDTYDELEILRLLGHPLEKYIPL